MISLFLTIIESEEDKSKFKRIYNQYESFITKTISDLTKDNYIFQVSFQETFFTIAKNINKVPLDNEKMARSFLYTIARTRTINEIKHYNRTSFLSLDDFIDKLGNEDEFKSDEAKEAYAMIINKIYSLPEIYRTVLELNILQGFTCEEIAKLLNTSIGTIKSRLSKAKKYIRQWIRSEYVYE